MVAFGIIFGCVLIAVAILATIACAIEHLYEGWWLIVVGTAVLGSIAVGASADYGMANAEINRQREVRILVHQGWKIVAFAQHQTMLKKDSTTLTIVDTIWGDAKHQISPTDFKIVGVNADAPLVLEQPTPTASETDAATKAARSRYLADLEAWDAGKRAFKPIPEDYK